MTVTELFFGRDIDGRMPLTDTEWSEFTQSVVTKEFPDGFTVLDGDGEWRDSATHNVVRERAKILLVATRPDTRLEEKIDRISGAYRRAFAQASVGVLTYEACGAFGN